MSEIHPEVNQVIIPVAGIANWGHKNHSTAAVYLAPLRMLLSKQLHVPVLPPVVPSGFGVFGSTKSMSEHFKKDIEHSLAEYPNARVQFIAHSFGGLLCRELVLASSETRERHTGTITLGSPHLGVRVGKWKGFEETEKSINAYAQDIQQGHVDDGHSTGLTMIATSLDVMVSPYSALPELPNKDRHIFAHPGSTLPSIGTVETHLNMGIEHAGLMVHPQAMMLTSQLARKIIKQQSGDFPTPELMPATS